MVIKYSFFLNNVPTTKTTIAHDPERSITSPFICAISVKFFSAASNPFLKASLGLEGKFVSLITF